MYKRYAKYAHDPHKRYLHKFLPSVTWGNLVTKPLYIKDILREFKLVSYENSISHIS